MITTGCDTVTPVAMSDEQEPAHDEVYHLLSSGWSKPDMPDGWVRLTLKAVADIPHPEQVEALWLLKRRTSWRPESADIRRAVVELRGIFPSLAEAGRQGRRYARKRADIETGGPQKAYPFTHPAVADAVAAAGFDLATPDGGASFIKAYREVVEARTSEIIAGPLNQPVDFHPAKVGPDREPPAGVTWADGWRNPAGELIRPDSGTQAALPGPEPQPTALPT